MIILVAQVLDYSRLEKIYKKDESKVYCRKAEEPGYTAVDFHAMLIFCAVEESN